jgi:hypothetical protein
VKNLILLVILVVAGYFAWDHFKTPTLGGDPLPDESRVLFLQAAGPVSVTDHLAKDRWTIILFTAPGSAESDAIERRMETAVRQRVKTVRLVIIDVGGTGSAAAASMKITKLPSAIAFDGFSQRYDELEPILKLLGA